MTETVKAVAIVIRAVIPDLPESQVVALAIDCARAALNRAPLPRFGEGDPFVRQLRGLQHEIASTPMLDAYGAERRNHWSERLGEIIRQRTGGS